MEPKVDLTPELASKISSLCNVIGEAHNAKADSAGVTSPCPKVIHFPHESQQIVVIIVS